MGFVFGVAIGLVISRILFYIDDDDEEFLS